MQLKHFILLTVIIFFTLVVVDHAQQKPPLTCEEIVGGLYIQNSQLQRQLSDANQRAAVAEAELAKLKEAK